MYLFLTPAFANTSPAAASFDFMGFLPFVLIIGIMYFLLIRPQQKKAKAHQALLKTLKAGDKILTASGMMCKVAKILDEAEIEVELAKDVKVKMLRSSVSQILNHNTVEKKQQKKAPSKATKPTVKRRTTKK